MIRHVPWGCARPGCPGVLGHRRGSVLVVPAAAVRVRAGRTAVACPVCGLARAWHGVEVVVPPRRPLPDAA